MRRKDKETSNPSFYDLVLNKAEIIFLAFNDGQYPYCLPFNFATIGNKIYIHSALEGKKLDLLRIDAHVAFSTAIDIEIDAEKASTYYKSICGTGLASVVEDKKEKGNALDAIALRYNAIKCVRPALETSIDRVVIIRVDIQNMTGKQSLKKP